VLRSRVGIRLPTTALPIGEDDLDEHEGPARKRLHQPIGWPWYVLIAVIACAAAWVLGGR
jgi:hypothetical protein